MNVYLSTLGCRLNEAELSTWSRQFRDAGHAVVASPQGAHVMVLNTCAVTAAAGRKSRQLARRLHRQNPEGKLVLTGCYSEIEPEKAAQLAGVDLVIGNTEKDGLVGRVLDAISEHTMPKMATEPDAEHVYAASRTRAFVKVQDGCRNKCSFCIVTVARGAERSRTIDDIVSEIETLHANGTQEVVLTGVHLGGYGSDLGTSLKTLIAEVLLRTDIPRIRFGSLEPWDLPDDFFELWQNSRLCPHLHLPLQSGCDSVLRRMARRCFTAQFTQLIADARKTIPGFVVTSDLIVGFPGETDNEWAQTLEYIQTIEFGHLHIFSYSAREGTRAAQMPNPIAGDVKKHRSHMLHTLAAEMKLQTLQRYVGTSRPVLWEGRPAPQPNGRIRWTGYTDNYLRTEVDIPPGENLKNQLTQVQLESVVDGQRLSATLLRHSA